MKECRASAANLTFIFCGDENPRRSSEDQTWILLRKLHMFCHVLLSICSCVHFIRNVTLIMFFLFCQTTQRDPRKNLPEGGKKKWKPSPDYRRSGRSMDWRPVSVESYMRVAERESCQRYTPGPVSSSASALPHRTKRQVRHKRLFVLQPRLIWKQDNVHRY